MEIDLFGELVAVCRALGDAKIPYAVVGGLAVSIYVQPRATLDLDLLVREEDADRIAKSLAPVGYLDQNNVLEMTSIRIRRLIKFVGSEYLILDLLLADAESESGLWNAYATELSGTDVLLAPIPILIELKNRRGSPQDKVDIAALEQVQLRGMLGGSTHDEN